MLYFIITLRPLSSVHFRESIYRLLPQTTPENVSKNFSHYSVDPTTRYPNISLNFLKPSQVRAGAKSQILSLPLSLVPYKIHKVYFTYLMFC